MLSGFARFRPKRVDWQPAAEDVHAILNGSNLFQLPHFVGVLTKSGADPDLAEAFLRGGGHGILMLAMLEYEPMRDPALELLRALSGEDHGDDVEHWRAWIASL